MARTKTTDTTTTHTPKRTRAPRPAAAPAAAPVSADDRRRMIAEAAYYHALDRNFQGGDPTDDWLLAEREVNQRLLDAPSL
jgi:hypothetical protein